MTIDIQDGRHMSFTKQPRYEGLFEVISWFLVK